MRYRPHGNHKAKIYSRFTKDKEKRIKAYHYRKSSVHKKRHQRTYLQIRNRLTENKLMVTSREEWGGAEG